MIGKPVRIGLFILICLAQLSLPISRILTREWVLAHGRNYKFRTAPVDPYDAFRGRYVALGFDAENLSVPSGGRLKNRQRAWGVLQEDKEGFATIVSVSAEKPTGAEAIKVRARYPSDGKTQVDLPFDRFYMEESIAPKAEMAYRDHSRAGERDAYVTVKILGDTAVLQELYIGGKPAKEAAREAAKPSR